MIVLDTHALVWWLADPSKLSVSARRTIQANARSAELIVSAASILEIATLVRRGRLALSTGMDQWLADVRTLPELTVEPVTAEIAARAGSFDAQMHGDPIDRIIVATALSLKTPIVSADNQIHALTWVRTIW